MIRLINHTSAEQYWFGGNSVAFPDVVIRKPLSATGAFLTDASHLLLEGTYRIARETASHAFSIRFLPPFTQTVVVEIVAAHLGKLVGHMYALGTNYQLLAVSEGGAIGASIELVGAQDIHVAGVISVAGASMGFSATGSPGTDRTSGANVVGILGGRRA